MRKQIKMNEHYTLHAADIRKGQFYFHGPQFIRNIISDTKQAKEGMRVYLVDGKLQLESNEQFALRVYCEHKSW